MAAGEPVDVRPDGWIAVAPAQPTPSALDELEGARFVGSFLAEAGVPADLFVTVQEDVGVNGVLTLSTTELRFTAREG